MPESLKDPRRRTWWCIALSFLLLLGGFIAELYETWDDGVEASS